MPRRGSACDLPPAHCASPTPPKSTIPPLSSPHGSQPERPWFALVLQRALEHVRQPLPDAGDGGGQCGDRREWRGDRGRQQLDQQHVVELSVDGALESGATTTSRRWLMPTSLMPSSSTSPGAMPASTPARTTPSAPSVHDAPSVRRRPRHAVPRPIVRRSAPSTAGRRRPSEGRSPARRRRPIPWHLARATPRHRPSDGARSRSPFAGRRPRPARRGSGVTPGRSSDARRRTATPRRRRAAHRVEVSSRASDADYRAQLRMPAPGTASMPPAPAWCSRPPTPWPAALDTGAASASRPRRGCGRVRPGCRADTQQPRSPTRALHHKRSVT